MSITLATAEGRESTCASVDTIRARTGSPVKRCGAQAYVLAAGLLMLAGIALLASTPADAQSASIASPTPLGPGANAGAVDSFAGTRYVYFWAGPGAFSVTMSFQSMGLVGQPLRASLGFDFYDEHQKMVSHNVVVSNDKMEHAQTSGSYDTRRRLVVALSPPTTLIRTGGRFRIEATGAVSFDAVAPMRGPAGKLSGEEALVHPVGALVQSTGPLVQSGGALVQSGGSLVRQSSPLVRNVGPLMKPLTVQETPNRIHLILAGDVLFDFDEAVIRPDASAALQQVPAVVASRAHGIVLVEGHTDSKGSAEHNQTLSRDRAEAVQRWLSANAPLRATRFEIVALGASHPAAPNALPDGRDNPVGRQRNRRVEIVIEK